MLEGEFPAAGEATRDELRAAYDDLLAATIQSAETSTVAGETGIDESTLEALLDSDSPKLSLEDTAAILGTDSDRPDAETILAEARNILLMGMSAAVLDVEAVAAGIDDEMEPKEIQQKIEGRHPMSLDEYALLHSYIEGEKR
ncbi:MAG: DUF5791 family protein [Haloarculaceae archaeon]|jgi:hypothetical protein